MSGLTGLSAAFRRCAGELGMWSASTLFVSTARAEGGDDAVQALDAALGSEFPVLAMVASTDPAPDVTDEVVRRCDGLDRLVVVGIEADCLGPFLDLAPRALEVALILDPTFAADQERLAASWGARVKQTDLTSFQRFAGARSALLTTVYGTDGFHAVVSRAWLRCHGDDVRTQFGRFIGWNVLPSAMELYPRWLVESDVGDFTDLIGSP